MSSPAKKRKTNEYKASPKTIRSLDYFFAKQKNENAKLVNDNTNQQDSDKLCEDTKEEALDDEQLARKLQAQWNEEDRAVVRATVPTTSPSRSSSKPPGNEGISLESILDSIGTDSLENGDLQEFTADDTKKDEQSPAKENNTLTLQSASAKEDTVSITISFDESPLTFDSAKYIPALKEQWVGEGGSATYALLTRCFVLVNSTQSRIKIVDTLVNFLRTIIEADPESLLPAVRFTNHHRGL